MSAGQPDATLEAAFRTFLEQQWGARLEKVVPVAPGLGTRRFYRLQISGAQAPAPSLIARVEAEEDPAKRASGAPPEPPLEPARAFLEASGIRVPALYGEVEAARCVFLEDVGDMSLERYAHEASAPARREMYARACEITTRLQALEAPTPPIAAFERRLDRALFESKASRVVDWALPYWLPRPPEASDERVVRALYAQVATLCEAAPLRLSHRDYKAANLHITREDELVLIDIQGAFLAPPEYDLVCLLRDSHVGLPWEEVESHLESTRERLPDAPSKAEFEARFTALTLTRVAKDAAHYIYAHTHGGDDRYLRLLPEARRVLQHAAARAAEHAAVYADFARLTAELREP